MNHHNNKTRELHHKHFITDFIDNLNNIHDELATTITHKGAVELFYEKEVLELVKLSSPTETPREINS